MPTPRLVSDPDEAMGAAGVVLPGVGAFGRCAQALRATGLDAAVDDALDRGTPFLGICVGFQLLYEGSEESPAVPGLGVLAGTVRALAPGVKRPQMQWNRLVRRPGAPNGLLGGLPASPWVYFVHSFAPELSAHTVATCDYGGTVAAAAERGPVWGTQFHPEKSGAAGLAMLGNFVAACGALTADAVSGAMELFPAIDLRDGGPCASSRVTSPASATTGTPWPWPAATPPAGRAGSTWWTSTRPVPGFPRTGRPCCAWRVPWTWPCRPAAGCAREADAAALLDHGVARVVVGTLALEHPDVLEAVADRYPGRVAVGLDHRGGGAEVAVDGVAPRQRRRRSPPRWRG